MNPNDPDTDRYLSHNYPQARHRLVPRKAVPRYSHGQKISEPHTLALAWHMEAPNTEGNNITGSCGSPYKHGQVGIRVQYIKPP